MKNKHGVDKTKQKRELLAAAEAYWEETTTNVYRPLEKTEGYELILTSTDLVLWNKMAAYFG